MSRGRRTGTGRSAGRRGPGERSSPSSYPELPGLDQVLLEGAPIQRVVVDGDRCSVVVDAALLGGHPDYEPPPRGEVHCRCELLLQIRGLTTVEGDPTRLGTRLRDLRVAPTQLTFVGDGGSLVVRGGTLRVRRARV